MTAIHRGGLADPTLAAICKLAGFASVSMVNHYFKGKTDLLECTMRELAADFLGQVALRTSSAPSPTERVLAVIDGNFAPSQCTPEGCRLLAVVLVAHARQPRVRRNRTHHAPLHCLRVEARLKGTPAGPGGEGRRGNSDGVDVRHVAALCAQSRGYWTSRRHGESPAMISCCACGLPQPATRQPPDRRRLGRQPLGGPLALCRPVRRGPRRCPGPPPGPTVDPTRPPATIITASVSTRTPVLMVGSGTGAKYGE